MTSVKDRVTQGLSEIRNIVLGVQILLGFQYEVAFQTGFSRLDRIGRLFEAAGLGLLTISLISLITSIGFNRLAERGAMTPRQENVNQAAVAVALAPFGVALGLDVYVALERQLGASPAAIAGTLLAFLAFVFWYGGALLRAGNREKPDSLEEPVSLKDRIGALLTESRIVLPGAQALLGFQLAAYLTDGYQRAPADARLAHTGGLMLLIVAMILLMAPAAFHRLAERGEDTARVERVSATLILAAMAPLGLAMSADLFVVCRLVGATRLLALLAAGVATLACGAAWYLFPLAARAKSVSDRRQLRPGTILVRRDFFSLPPGD